MSNEERSFASRLFAANPQLMDEAPDLSHLEEKYKLRKVNLEEEDATGNTFTQTYYVAEGDLLLDQDEVLLYDMQQEAIRSQRQMNDRLASFGLEPLDDTLPEGLIGITDGDKLVRWGDGVVLSYCVLKRSFSAEADYELVRDHMKEATEDWENTCGIKFQHREDLDDSVFLRPPGALFVVREINAGGAFIAAAFFPNDPKWRRRVFIDPSYYNTSFNKVGVLRHELGHVLGFRHEHIRSGAPAECRSEDLEDTEFLTQYDPMSVMHYFCGGVGSIDLAITNIDKTGSQKVYGLPLSRYSFIMD